MFDIFLIKYENKINLIWYIILYFFSVYSCLKYNYNINMCEKTVLIPLDLDALILKWEHLFPNTTREIMLKKLQIVSLIENSKEISSDIKDELITCWINMQGPGYNVNFTGDLQWSWILLYNNKLKNLAVEDQIFFWQLLCDIIYKYCAQNTNTDWQNLYNIYNNILKIVVEKKEPLLNIALTDININLISFKEKECFKIYVNYIFLWKINNPNDPVTIKELLDFYSYIANKTERSEYLEEEMRIYIETNKIQKLIKGDLTDPDVLARLLIMAHKLSCKELTLYQFKALLKFLEKEYNDLTHFLNYLNTCTDKERVNQTNFFLEKIKKIYDIKERRADLNLKTKNLTK